LGDRLKFKLISSIHIANNTASIHQSIKIRLTKLKNSTYNLTP